ncbi:MAG: M48 family metalloprotease [Hyphomicrobiaceae bacterium]
MQFSKVSVVLCVLFAISLQYWHSSNALAQSSPSQRTAEQPRIKEVVRRVAEMSALPKPASSEFPTRSTMGVPPIVNNYVNGLLGQLLTSSQIGDPRLKVSVLPCPAFSDYSTSSGSIVLCVETVRRLNTVGQLAFLIGHEAGHILSRHRPLKRSVANLSVLSVPIVNSIYGAVLANEGKLQHRNEEQEADQIAIDLLVAARFNPGEGVSFFEVLSKALPEKQKTNTVLGNIRGGASGPLALNDVLGMMINLLHAPLIGLDYGVRQLGDERTHPAFMERVSGIQAYVAKFYPEAKGLPMSRMLDQVMPSTSKQWFADLRLLDKFTAELAQKQRSSSDQQLETAIRGLLKQSLGNWPQARILASLLATRRRDYANVKNDLHVLEQQSGSGFDIYFTWGVMFDEMLPGDDPLWRGLEKWKGTSAAEIYNDIAIVYGLRGNEEKRKKAIELCKIPARRLVRDESARRGYDVGPQVEADVVGIVCSGTKYLKDIQKQWDVLLRKYSFAK